MKKTISIILCLFLLMGTVSAAEVEESGSFFGKLFSKMTGLFTKDELKEDVDKLKSKVESNSEDDLEKENERINTMKKEYYKLVKKAETRRSHDEFGEVELAIHDLKHSIKLKQDALKLRANLQGLSFGEVTEEEQTYLRERIESFEDRIEAIEEGLDEKEVKAIHYASIWQLRISLERVKLFYENGSYELLDSLLDSFEVKIKSFEDGISIDTTPQFEIILRKNGQKLRSQEMMLIDQVRESLEV